MRKIEIRTDRISVKARLNESLTAREIWNVLPVRGVVNTWGDEIYFQVPVQRGLEAGREVVREGDLGYWPPGHAFCVFFGQTPISRSDEVRPASPVCVIGNVLDDIEILKEISSGDEIVVRPLNE
jgi:hypothetical protein